MAKSAKITLATRNPEACELIAGILTAGFRLVSKNKASVWTIHNAVSLTPNENKISCGWQAAGSIRGRS
jgi:hypothetical protein